MHLSSQEGQGLPLHKKQTCEGIPGSSVIIKVLLYGLSRYEYVSFYPMNFHCPRCAAEVVEFDAFRRSIAFCENCGWNVAGAERILRARIRVLWIASGIGIILALLAWARGPLGLMGAAQIAAAFVLGPVSFGFVARYRLSKLLATQQRVAPGVTAQGPGSINARNNPAWNAEEIHQGWTKYYRLRNWARIGLLALPPTILFLLTHERQTLVLLGLQNLRPVIQLEVLSAVNAICVIPLCIPLVRWAEWKKS